MRGQRNRRGRQRALEEHALARQAIEARGLRELVAVRAQVVRARCIECDEQDVGGRPRGAEDAGRARRQDCAGDERQEIKNLEFGIAATPRIPNS